MTQAERIVRLKIQLDDWQPIIWRRVEVPLTASLKALHDVIQAVMPFLDYHLFEFNVGDRRYGIPDPEWDTIGRKTYAAKITKLSKLIDRGSSKFNYTYDFGDNWQHTVTVEAVSAAEPMIEYPRYIDGGGRAPPEDVGGLSGFENFLEAMADPDHEEHDAVKTWYGALFDPEIPDNDAIRTRMAKLARRRTLGKAAFIKSRNQVN